MSIGIDDNHVAAVWGNSDVLDLGRESPMMHLPLQNSLRQTDFAAQFSSKALVSIRQVITQQSRELEIDRVGCLMRFSYVFAYRSHTIFSICAGVMF